MKEYAEAVRCRYQRATRGHKGRVLDEFTKVTGYHRKSAIRLLSGNTRSIAEVKRGR